MAEIASSKRVLVTGASGFAGRSVIPDLVAAGFEVHATARSACSVPRAARFVVADLLNSRVDALLEDVDAVVHLAARAHVMVEFADNPEAEYMQDNCTLTRHLAEAASRAGVRHFVYSSSVKVMGEATHIHPYSECEPCNPSDAYGRSKHAAEQALKEISLNSNLSVTTLRPPLMYGPGVRGNFLRLMRMIELGVPLPFSSVKNGRSLLGIRNFASAIGAVLNAPAVGYRMYLVTDGLSVSTPELVRELANALGRKPRMFSAPNALLKLAGQLTGYRDEIDRLMNSLIIDDSSIRNELGWSPPRSFQDGLREMARHFHESSNSAR